MLNITKAWPDDHMDKKLTITSAVDYVYIIQTYTFLSIYLFIYFCPIGSDEVLLKIILEFLSHINAFNRMEINLLS